MSIELECKLRLDTHEEIRRKLRAAGGRYIGRVLETNRILDRDDGSLSRAGCGLRIRAIRVLDGDGPESTLTFKGPRINSTETFNQDSVGSAFKRREEFEIAVEDSEALSKIFGALGFYDRIVFEKRRESWKLGDCKIELDEVPILGHFAEVEGPSEDAIEKVLRKLHLTGQPRVSNSYVSMLASECTARSVSPRVIRF